jgi:hypothetical protein
MSITRRAQAFSGRKTAMGSLILDPEVPEPSIQDEVPEIIRVDVVPMQTETGAGRRGSQIRSISS